MSLRKASLVFCIVAFLCLATSFSGSSAAWARHGHYSHYRLHRYGHRVHGLPVYAPRHYSYRPLGHYGYRPSVYRHYGYYRPSYSHYRYGSYAYPSYGYGSY